jgi:hypothetical protein
VEWRYRIVPVYIDAESSVVGGAYNGMGDITCKVMFSSSRQREPRP